MLSVLPSMSVTLNVSRSRRMRIVMTSRGDQQPHRAALKNTEVGSDRLEVADARTLCDWRVIVAPLSVFVGPSLREQG
jgi:hypothetical protein